MCYPCTHCNKCGRQPKPGTCALCGHVNGEGALVCAQCGAKFPAPPGGGRRATVRKVTSENDSGKAS